MPKNQVIKLGVLLIAASALIWLGTQLAKWIEWVLPYTAAAGVLLIVVGVFVEIRREKQQSHAEASAAE